METKPIMSPNFTRVIAEIRTRTGIDAVAAEALEEFLTEQCRMIDGYYEEEYYHELDIVRSTAYDAGYTAGYDAGYEVGHFEGYDVGLEDGYAV